MKESWTILKEPEDHQVYLLPKSGSRIFAYCCSREEKDAVDLEPAQQLILQGVYLEKSESKRQVQSSPQDVFDFQGNLF